MVKDNNNIKISRKGECIMTTEKLQVTAVKYSMETEKILTRINSMEFKKFRDSHTPWVADEFAFDGYAILKHKGDSHEYVCPLLKGKNFCLNRLFLDGDKLILSGMSVGGNIMAKNISLEAAIEMYKENESKWIPQLIEYKIW